MLIILITTSIIFIFVSFTLQIIFHELGHYYFGFLTGWKLIYLQFGHCVIYSDRNRKKYSFKMVPCKGFQCIMSPIDIDSNSVGYTLGGLIANLLLSFLGLIAIFKMYYSLFLSLFFLCFTVSGIALLVTNAIPKVKTVCNDMACFVLTNGSKMTSICHNTQLIIADELMQAKTYAMIREELFRQEEKIEINDITAYSIILNYYYHLDKNELQAAQKELIKINDYSKISNNIMHIYNLETIYLHMVMFMNGYETCINSLLSCGDKGEPYVNPLILCRDKSISYTCSLLSRRDKNISYANSVPSCRDKNISYTNSVPSCRDKNNSYANSVLSYKDKSISYVNSVLLCRDKKNSYTNSELHCRERKGPLKKNIKIGDIHELRVQIMHLVYIRMKNNDISGAIEALGEGVDSIKSFPCIYLGEKIFCERQLMDVYNIINRTSSNIWTNPS